MTAPYWLFSYGTLRQPKVQVALFGRGLDSVEDRLPGFRLDRVLIIDPAVVALSGSADHPILRRGGADDVVEGLALAVTDADLAKADSYEAAEYQRTGVTLLSGRRAFVYLHRDDQ